LEVTWRSYLSGTGLKVIDAICPVLALENVKVVSVHQMSPLSKESLLRNFGSLPKLKSFELSGSLSCSIRGLAGALGETGLAVASPTSATLRRSARRASKAKTPTRMYFPALQTISLTGADFEEGSEPLLEELQNALAARKKNKQGLKKLTMTRCIHLLEEDVAELETVVGDVEWDEEVIGLTESEEEEEDEYFGDYAIGSYVFAHDLFEHGFMSDEDEFDEFDDYY
jgi:hypothetical protein